MFKPLDSLPVICKPRCNQEPVVAGVNLESLFSCFFGVEQMPHRQQNKIASTLLCARTDLHLI